MARKRYTPEQIIGKLREAEVRFSQGEKIGAISRSLEISEQGSLRMSLKFETSAGSSGRYSQNTGLALSVSHAPSASA